MMNSMANNHPVMKIPGFVQRLAASNSAIIIAASIISIIIRE